MILRATIILKIMTVKHLILEKSIKLIVQWIKKTKKWNKSIIHNLIKIPNLIIKFSPDIKMIDLLKLKTIKEKTIIFLPTKTIVKKLNSSN